MYVSYFTYPSVDGRLGCFHILAIVLPWTWNINVSMRFFLILIIFKNFYWSTVDLQCCSFRSTPKWICYSNINIYNHSFLDCFHYGVLSMVLSAMDPLLVTYFIYCSVCMYTSIPWFLSLPPSLPPPTLPVSNHNFVFYICDSVFVV